MKRKESMNFNVREIREERGITQTALANLAGVSRNTIATLETGKRLSTSTDTLDRIAKVLKVDVRELIRE